MIPCFRQTTRTSYDRNCRQQRIGNVPRPGNFMDRNLHAEKHCDKRFLDRVINLIHDLGLKALWSLIPFFWALSPFLWALSSEPWSQSYFGLWALSPYTMLRPWNSEVVINCVVSKDNLWRRCGLKITTRPSCYACRNIECTSICVCLARVARRFCVVLSGLSGESSSCLSLLARALLYYLARPTKTATPTQAS